MIRRKVSVTLVEVLLSAIIFLIAITGVVGIFYGMFVFTDVLRMSTKAIVAINSKMEEIRKSGFDNLDSYNGEVFELTGFSPGESKGRVEVRDISGYTDFKEVRIVASFKCRGRVIGEDKNLNGVLDAGEDSTVYGEADRLDSPVEIITLMTR